MKKFQLSLLLLPLLLIIILSSCESDKKITKEDSDTSSSLFTLLPSSETGISFSNTLKENIVKNIQSYDYFYNGSGVAVGDINNDGLVDVVFTANQMPNKLYLNKGKMQFEDVTKNSGINVVGQFIPWSNGVTMVDINEDGYLDIYVCNSGPYFKRDDIRKNQLFINNGDLTFTEKAAEYGLDDSAYSSQASFFDYDKDGDLDMFLANHSIFKNLFKHLVPTPEKRDAAIEEYLSNPENYSRVSNKLFNNQGNGKFLEVSKPAGVSDWGYGLGLVTSDFNNDGWVDIYVSNDFRVEDFLYYNNGDGTFTNKIKESTGHTSWYGMGCDASDFNNDGWLDIAVVDMTPEDRIRSKTLMPSMNVALFDKVTKELGYHYQYMFNTLQRNNGNGTFSEIGQIAGTAKTDWSWSSLFADFDNDGWKDYFITNGFKRDTKNQDVMAQNKVKLQNKENITQKDIFEISQNFPSVPLTNYIYQNTGKDYGLKKMTSTWGLNETSFSNGAVYADLDNDGDLDLLINNIDQEAFVYQNNGNKNNYLRVKLIGQSAASARNAKVTLITDKMLQYQELAPTKGYYSQVEDILHFGLGQSESIDTLKIDWLSGKSQVIIQPTINQVLEIAEKNAAPSEATSKTKAIFTDITNTLNLNYQHQENNFNDFQKEVLLPHRQSTLGPHVAVGDVNQDGMEDFYVGGAKGQSGSLFLQELDGTFTQSTSTPWSSDKNSEDIGVLFFDADQDKDLDLYVVSGGGSEFEMNDPALQDRLYLNDGKGNFNKSKNALPSMATNGFQVKAGDFDQDGDLDLFVGGGVLSHQYPHPAKSYLLQNEGGTFKNITATVAPELETIGLVKDAVWCDFNQDQRLDLVVVGEWMPISLFENKGDTFENVSAEYGLEETVGWWYSVSVDDFDSDGDLDFIVGNIGKNTKFHVTPEHPLDIYAYDFDDNNTMDIVLGANYGDKLFPVRGKECSTQQMPFISEKFPTYKGFAEASMDDIYGAEKMAKAYHRKATIFTSIFLENKGSENMVIKELPMDAQVAPINRILISDVNKDGHKDIIVAGNMHGTEVETPRYDAGIGLYLQGDGKGNFSPVNVNKSGLYLPRDVKDMQVITSKSTQQAVLLVTNNNSPLQAIQIQN